MSRVRDAGDAGLLLELEPVIDARVNARALGIAEAFRQRGFAGVRDVIATYRSVAVYFDPLRADAPALKQALEEAAATAAPHADGPVIDIPVSYGGGDGPDVDVVAAHAGLSVPEVIARHADAEYRVFMLGFMPGFAYMGSVDETIALPRRATPRVRVPAGSVGIAGRQTGVYPFESPGGWHLIGRTGRTMFDAARERVALCAPGDRVRFVPDAGTCAALGEREHTRPPAAARRQPDVVVVRPGLFTTVQDAGRWGHQSDGVPVAGAMDGVALRIANAAVGNAPDAAALEVTLLGPELRIESPLTLAVAGAELSATLDGRPVPMGMPVTGDTGSVLRFGERMRGGRAYIAFEGGLAVPSVLGSRSTHTRSGMGGLQGRALRAGDELGVARVPFAGAVARVPLDLPPTAAWSNRRVTLRVLPGPQDDWFPAQALDLLQSTRFTVHHHSDRMGLRLTAAHAIPRLHEDEMISDATFPGALQVPASGEPILLLADRPTTGGYPQVAVVISADLPLAGQLIPGDDVAFRVCSMEEARAALHGHRRSKDA